MKTENMDGTIKITDVFPDEPLQQYKKLELAENISALLEAFAKAGKSGSQTKVS